MRKFILLLPIFILVLSGCKTSRSNVALKPDVTWTTLAVPFKLNILDGPSPSGKGYFVRDESIYLSIRYFGMEMMSFYANNDSCYVYDRSNLIACPFGTNPITHRKMGVNDLQDILLGLNPDAKPMSLNLLSLIINLAPIYLDQSDGVASFSGWEAIVQNLDTHTQIEASLKWDFGSADNSPESIRQWNRPKKPKNIYGLNELYYLIVNQF